MSTPETTPADTSPAPKQPHPLQKPIRIILFTALGIAIVALLIDQRARSAAQTAFDTLNAKLGPEQRLNEVSREEVWKLVGREPDADENPDDTRETYSWRGALRSQVLYVEYRHGANKILKDVSINKPPAGFPAQ